MNRNVREIFYKPREGDVSSPRPFKDFQTARNVILLGDPGAGKTHVFRDAAATEGGRFITARAFLTTPARLLTQETFYIDGLDERRAGRGDRDTVDKLVEKLFEVSPTKVRISCRVADWLGESDLAAINPFFDQSETATVVVLEKLSPREQRAVLEALGMNDKQADAFCKQADERGLTDFLENPQNLTMLWRAVQTGKWPDTRKQLFELATELMLGEFDKEHARKGLGTYTVKELRSVAGAICAAWLISDIEAISLTDQEGTKETPGYRSLTLAEAEKVQAALGRRVFIAAALEPETVDYAHRATAEFLGAEWLAQKVRNGLPIGRLQALMGVDGQPASELRGLHAWLAVHLPTHAKALIEADPYGVLTYGDAAALSTPACAHLVHSLGKLSKVNPWFRSGGQASPSIGALARKDIVPEFQKVLRSATVGFGIRSVVVDALSIGAPLPEMKKDLVTGVQSNNWPYRDRAVAMNTLLRLGQDGKDAVIQIFRSGLGASENDYRLRTIILERLYGDPFGVADVVELINSFLNVKANRAGGPLWNLSEKLPPADLPAILDGIEPLRDDEDKPRERRNEWDVGSFFDKVLLRVWTGGHAFEVDRALQWLKTRSSFSHSYSGSRGAPLHDAVKATPNRVRALAAHFVETLALDSDRWLTFNRFRDLVFHEASTDMLLEVALEAMGRTPEDVERELFLYELAYALSYNASRAFGAPAFDRLYAMADNQPGFAAIRDKSVATVLPHKHLEWKIKRAEDDGGQSPEILCANFAKEIVRIRSGEHTGWLNWASHLYFGLFEDCDHALEPRERLTCTRSEWRHRHSRQSCS